MMQKLERKVIFLDYDGVLHSVTDEKEFVHVGILEQILSDFSGLEIVLSTGWLSEYGLEKTRSFLPTSLQRIINDGVDCLGEKRTTFASRYSLIQEFCIGNSISHWLALDDLFGGEELMNWAEVDIDRLILCDKSVGLGDINKQAELRYKIQQYFFK
jgi:hypothetical protein